MLYDVAVKIIDTKLFVFYILEIKKKQMKAKKIEKL